jgi:hypothetical protein
VSATRAALAGALAAAIGAGARAQAPIPPSAPAAEDPVARGDRRVVSLGPSAAQRASRATLELPLVARADEEIVAAAIAVELEPSPGGAAAIEVLVNDERVALLAADEVARGGVHEAEVDAGLLASRNLLVLRRPADAAAACDADETPWARVRAVRAALRTAPVPLPDELALLPLPFLDAGHDPAATIPVVLAGEPTPERVRLAALVASWLALDAPIPVRFEARLGALPDGRAVVLVDGDAAAQRLGLDAPPGPSVRMVDHPAHAGSNAKLLVVAGRDLDELRVAAEHLASGARLAGPEARLSPPPPPPPAPPYSAPRWLPAGERVPFSRYPGAEALGHGGTDPATLSLRFRVAPDLWVWPAPAVLLDLGVREGIPPGVTPPRLDVELNGSFVATLPAPERAGETSRRVRLRIPREHLRGYNELLVHVRYPERDPCAAAAAAPAGEPPWVQVTGDSVLHIDRLDHYAPQPDVALFAFDGWPFTRVPDLSETVVVLPDAPGERALSLVLSIMGRLAQVTGRAGTGALFVSGRAAGEAALAGRDVLLVGANGDNALLSSWASRLPVELAPGRARVRAPRGWARAAVLLGGARPLLEVRRGDAFLAGPDEVAAIAGIESPVTPGRTAIAVTATSAAALPPFGEFLGHAESRARSGDLLVLADGRRALLRVGPTFDRGRLSPWTRIRWTIASRWVLLVPALAAGTAVLAVLLRRLLARRMRARLAEEWT